MNPKSLIWGVKASFRGYVEAAGGSITLADGARQREDGTFEFPASPDSQLNITADGSATGSARFEGTVSFEAHGGMLKSTLSEIGVEVGSEGLVLTALDTQMNQGRCAIATLQPTESHAGHTLSLTAQITMDGMYQIADNYPPGTELDPVHLN